MFLSTYVCLPQNHQLHQTWNLTTRPSKLNLSTRPSEPQKHIIISPTRPLKLLKALKSPPSEREGGKKNMKETPTKWDKSLNLCYVVKRQAKSKQDTIQTEENKGKIRIKKPKTARWWSAIISMLSSSSPPSSSTSLWSSSPSWFFLYSATWVQENVTSRHKTQVAPPLAHTIAFRSRSSNEGEEGITKFFSKWDFFFGVLVDSPNFLFCNS